MYVGDLLDSFYEWGSALLIYIVWFGDLRHREWLLTKIILTTNTCVVFSRLVTVQRL